MASSKYWALYAKRYRIGELSEHQLAGVRIGAVGIRLDWNVPQGWRITVYCFRLSFEVGWALSRTDPRIEPFLHIIMRQDGVDGQTATERMGRAIG